MEFLLQVEHAVEDAVEEVRIRHCTLVPGWGIGPGCDPKRPAKPSLELYKTNCRVIIEHSIVGSIQVFKDEVRSEPLEINITDSVIDATRDEREALGAPNWPRARGAADKPQHGYWTGGNEFHRPG